MHLFTTVWNVRIQYTTMFSTDLGTNLHFHDEISPLDKICVVWIVEKRTTENTLEIEQITVVFKQTRYFPKNVKKSI